MHNQKLNSYLGESNAFPYFSVYSHIFDTALILTAFFSMICASPLTDTL